MRGNAIAERWIGGCRRELLDRTLIWNQAHLRRILRQYETHHNQHRPHRSLNSAAPLKPLPEPVDLERYHVRRHARISGMINEYRLVAWRGRGSRHPQPADHSLGRSCGALTTKVHPACKQGQKPLSVVITAGQRGDTPQFRAVLEGIAVPRLGPGPARTRPDRVLADKAYGSRADGGYLRRRGIACTIPEKARHAQHVLDMSSTCPRPAPPCRGA